MSKNKKQSSKKWTLKVNKTSEPLNLEKIIINNRLVKVYTKNSDAGSYNYFEQ